MEINDSDLAFKKTGAGYGIRHNITTESTFMSGGDAFDDGAALFLFGSTHATLAGDIKLTTDFVDKLYYDHSAPNWNSQGIAWIFGANYHEMTEMSAPSAGGANTGRLYLDETGGKTKLMTTDTYRHVLAQLEVLIDLLGNFVFSV